MTGASVSVTRSAICAIPSPSCPVLAWQRSGPMKQPTAILSAEVATAATGGPRVTPTSRTALLKRVSPSACGQQPSGGGVPEPPQLSIVAPSAVRSQ